MSTRASPHSPRSHRARRVGFGVAVVSIGLGACGSDARPSAVAESPGTAVLAPGSTVAAAPVIAPTAVAPTTAAPTTVAPTTTTTTAASTTSTAPPTPTDPVGTDPGSLPQTRAEPASAGAQLDAHAEGLWHAIVTDDPGSAMAFFFPRSAYVSVKAIPDPAADYEQRLMANYVADIHTLHTALGADPTHAALGHLTVPPAAQWIEPGVEYNAIGYWRVYGAQLRYTTDGRQRSFAIASLISWRGQWYVVHLNSIR
jgi:hypothetical protein